MGLGRTGRARGLDACAWGRLCGWAAGRHREASTTILPVGETIKMGRGAGRRAGLGAARAPL
eukprot:10506612-Lingulodinium_polyedra.AAC.1